MVTVHQIVCSESCIYNRVHIKYKLFLYLVLFKLLLLYNYLVIIVLRPYFKGLQFVKLLMITFNLWFENKIIISILLNKHLNINNINEYVYNM